MLLWHAEAVKALSVLWPPPGCVRLRSERCVALSRRGLAVLLVPRPGSLAGSALGIRRLPSHVPPTWELRARPTARRRPEAVSSGCERPRDNPCLCDTAWPAPRVSPVTPPGLHAGCSRDTAGPHAGCSRDAARPAPGETRSCARLCFWFYRLRFCSSVKVVSGVFSMKCVRSFVPSAFLLHPSRAFHFHLGCPPPRSQA